jgi:Regulator of ribonuclease activity B
MTTRRKRARPGDVLEVRTPRGLAYVHYSARDPEYGDAIRVLPGFFTTRPADFTVLVSSPEAYFTFYPVGAAVSQGLVEVAARIPVPPGQGLPTVYRRAGARRPEGGVLAWIICEGKKETLVWELSEEQRYLPIARVWMHDTLISYLTEEWRPEHDMGLPRSSRSASTPPEAPKPSDDSTPRRVRHFLYFPSAKVSKAVADQLSTQGYTVERRKSDDGKNWLVLAGHTVNLEAQNLDSAREALARLAQEHSGEYDGHEVEVTPGQA